MRTKHKTLIIAMSTALLTTGSLYAQVRDPANAKPPAGPSTSAPLGANGLPGEVCSESSGSTCSGTFPANGSVTSSFEVTGCTTGVILDANIGVDITHAWVGDLVVTVTAPDATAVTIIDQPGQLSGINGCSGDNILAVLDDTAATPVEDECALGTPTISGTFSPNNPLAALNGVAGNGLWHLEVDDVVGLDGSGDLNDWSVDLTCGEPQPRATFVVNKVFTDGNPGEVDVTLNCFTGLPITQTQTISENQNVAFIVTDYDDGELDCEVTEEEATGYSAEYDNGPETSSESCEYDDVAWSATNVCTITNSPDPVLVEVFKDWIIEGSGGDLIDSGYKLVLYCDNEIVDGYEQDYPNWKKTLYQGDSNGTSDERYTAEVIPDWDGGTQCWVDEDVYDSAVEVNNDCGNLLVELGEGDSCTITNTVFYEGIPTLSNYGLALLTLMMLGVGFVGFRRFA